MSETQTAVRTEIPVTFRKGTPYAITYGAGSIFEHWTPGVGDTIVIDRGGKHSATISMDDATPVEWDELDRMWVEA